MERQVANTSAEPGRGDPRERRARPWRRLTVCSGALLATCFFLPAIQSCNAPLVPAEELWESLSREAPAIKVTYQDLSGAFVEFSMLLGPYLAGALLASGAAARLARWPRLDRFCRTTLFILLGGMSAGFVFIWLIEVADRPPSTLSDWLVALLLGATTLVALAYCVRVGLLPGTGPLCLRFECALALVIWFGLILGASASSGDACYGLYLSALASGLLLTAAVAEAVAITRQPLGWAILQLCLCRLRCVDWRGRCPECGYSLVGLPEMRCPECGRPLTAQELAEAANPDSAAPSAGGLTHATS